MRRSKLWHIKRLHLCTRKLYLSSCVCYLKLFNTERIIYRPPATPAWARSSRSCTGTDLWESGKYRSAKYRAQKSVCIYIHTHVYIYTYMCVYIHIYIDIYIYLVRVCVCINIYKFLHLFRVCFLCYRYIHACPEFSFKFLAIISHKKYKAQMLLALCWARENDD